ncbi:MAG: GNAT family N-acetyltransferase [Spirochaetes bacterium]|nr:GNAT family N-acetyltransferase [Spirochaetota bacterium]
MKINENYKIRDTVKQSDIKEIESIVRSTGFFPEEEIKIAVELIEERLNKGLESGYLFNFLEIDNEVAGYSCFGPIPLTNISYDLYWIAVHNKYRGKGYGSCLLKYSEEYMKKQGAYQIYVETSSKKQYKPTRRYYKKMGYKKIAHFKNFYNLHDGKVIYYKKLK